MVEKYVTGTQLKYFLPAAAPSSPVMACILDTGMWEAQAYKWRSPAWQWKEFDCTALVPLKSGVRAFAEGAVMPLMQLCAHQAFFALPKSTLDQLAKHLGAESQGAGDMFASLMALLKHVLPDLSLEQHLGIAEKRLGAMAHETAACVEELIELDDGIQMLGPEDEQELRKEIQQRASKEELIKSFASSLQEERRRRLPAKATCQSATRAGGYRGPKVLPTVDLDQKVARKLVPPGGYIWRSNTDGRWQGLFAHMPRISYPWSLYGHRGAAVRVLQDLWAHWCTAHGFDKTESPIADLWGAVQEAEEYVGEAASSSNA